MPLSWNIEKCPDPDAILAEGERGKTETLIFMTVATGIGHITEKNAAEFYARIKLLERIDGAFCSGFDSADSEKANRVDYFFTVDDIRARIGLHTNVAEESRAKWLARIKRRLDDSVREFNRAIAKAAEPAA